MMGRPKFMPCAGRVPPLALRATPSGTGSTQPAHGTPSPGGFRSHPSRANAFAWEIALAATLDLD